MRNKQFSQNQYALGVANSFAGGIFLMLAFGHLLPHSVSILESIHVDRSYAFSAALVGYLVIFFVEKIMFNSHSILHSVMEVHGGDHSHDHRHNHSYESHSENCDHVTGDASLHQQREVSISSAPTTPETSSVSALVDVPGIEPPFTDHDKHALINTPSTAHTSNSALSPRSAIILLLAMSVHSLFESMALGIATDKMSAFLMAASVGLHQPAESIALLVAFLKTNMPKAAIVKWLALYSFIAPLGVAVGMLISQIATPLVESIIVALTAGTFIYVGATEVVNEEFEDVSGTIENA